MISMVFQFWCNIPIYIFLVSYTGKVALIKVIFPGSMVMFGT